MVSASYDIPSATTLELSIFGAGIGEAVAVHVGDNEWILVDSCIDHRVQQPAALAYLAAIGVEAESVSTILITHWHEDHVSGVDGLIRNYPNAKIHLPSSFNSSELYALVNAGAERDTLGTDAFQTSRSFAKALGALVDTKKTLAVVPTQIDRLVRSKGIQMIGQISVTALSPSDFAAMTALKEFARFVEHDLPLRRRPVARDPNHSAIAIWIQWGQHRILLGSDLLDLPNPHLGWKAALGAQVLSSDPEKAIVVKVAHHGSKNGHSNAFWNAHVNTPVAGLTTYASTKSPPPQKSDIDRLKKCCSAVMCAPVPKAPRGLRGKAVAKFAQTQGITVTERVKRFGHVRIRLDPAGHIATACFGDAEVM